MSMMAVATRLFLFALLVGGALAAEGAQVALISAEEGNAYAEAAEAISAELRSTGHRLVQLPYPLRPEDSANLSENGLIITLGSRAAQAVASQAPRTMILHTLLPRSVFEHLPTRSEDARRVSAVFIDQPPSRQLELIHLALPDWQRIAVIVGRETQDLGARIQAAAQQRRLRVSIEQLADENDLYPTLKRALLPDPAVLLAVPDGSLYNNRNISNILLTAYRQHSPVVGFSPAYVKAGALLALFSTPTQIGQQAGEAARQGLATGTLPAPAAPRHFRVATNTYVARSMGIALDDALSLQDRLERLEGTP